MRHSLVNLDASDWRTSCDGSPNRIPCYTALGVHAMPQSSQSRFDAQGAAVPAARNVQSPEPRFLEQVANACRVKHLAYRTEQSYVSWVKRFILFYGKRHPQGMGPTEVRAFLAHLAKNRNVAASSQHGKGESRGVSDLTCSAAKRGALHAESGNFGTSVFLRAGTGPLPVSLAQSAERSALFSWGSCQGPACCQQC